MSKTYALDISLSFCLDGTDDEVEALSIEIMKKLHHMCEVVQRIHKNATYINDLTEYDLSEDDDELEDDSCDYAANVNDKQGSNVVQLFNKDNIITDGCCS